MRLLEQYEDSLTFILLQKQLVVVSQSCERLRSWHLVRHSQSIFCARPHKRGRSKTEIRLNSFASCSICLQDSLVLRLVGVLHSSPGHSIEQPSFLGSRSFSFEDPRILNATLDRSDRSRTSALSTAKRTTAINKAVRGLVVFMAS